MKTKKILLTVGLILSLGIAGYATWFFNNGPESGGNQNANTNRPVAIVQPDTEFKLQADTRNVIFENEKCVACGLCLKACPPRAMEVHF